MSRTKQPARKSPRDRSAVAEYRGEDGKEQGPVPMNQDNDEEQDDTNVHVSAEEKEEEDPSASNKDNQYQNEQFVIDMADDSDSRYAGPPVVDPVTQYLVIMINEVSASVAGQLFVLLGL